MMALTIGNNFSPAGSDNIEGKEKLFIIKTIPKKIDNKIIINSTIILDTYQYLFIERICKDEFILANSFYYKML